jgi:hypothetical protein
MPFYRITLGEYPTDVPYRSLSTHSLLNGGEVIETKEEVKDWKPCADDSIEVTHLGDVSQCTVEFTIRKVEEKVESEYERGAREMADALYNAAVGDFKGYIMPDKIAEARDNPVKAIEAIKRDAMLWSVADVAAVGEVPSGK